MLVACWSAKGGAGTTVVAAALALVLSRSAGASGGGVLLVDLAGDVPAVLGVGPGEARAPTLAHWLAVAPDVPADALGRIEEPVAPGLSLLRRGSGPFDAASPAAGELLAGLLAADPRRVVADCGRIDGDAHAAVNVALVRGAARSLLVVRPCYLALARAAAAPVRPTGVVLVVEPGRALTAGDVEQVVGAPVVARVRCSEQVARSVDAGLLACRPPRTLTEDLHGAA